MNGMDKALSDALDDFTIYSDYKDLVNLDHEVAGCRWEANVTGRSLYGLTAAALEHLAECKAMPQVKL